MHPRHVSRCVLQSTVPAAPLTIKSRQVCGPRGSKEKHCFVKRLDARPDTRSARRSGGDAGRYGIDNGVAEGVAELVRRFRTLRVISRIASSR
jgi:hypothetical protein